MIVFLAPHWLWLLAVVAVAAFVLVHLERRRERHLDALLGPRRQRLTSGVTTTQRALRRHTAIAAATLTVLALAQPSTGGDDGALSPRGVDVLVCLDVSRSMLARDVAPDRLQAAKAQLRALTAKLDGDRIGLVLFSGAARLAVPRTRDVATFLELLDVAQAGDVVPGGTDLGAALARCVDALNGASGDHEVVLLLTDGEDHEGRGLAIARKCRDAGITVHCVGFGTARGAKIPLATADGETFLRDGSGADVVSTLDATSLARIAAATGGRYVDAATTPDALVALHDDAIAPMARKSFDAMRVDARVNRFQWPLSIAFVLWMLAACWPVRR